MIALPHADQGDEEADADIEQREREGFGRAAEISELASLGEKEAVEEHLEHEKDEQNPDLDGQISARCPVRGAFQLVAAPEFIPFELEVAKMPAQVVQFETRRALGIGDRKSTRLNSSHT